MAQFQINKYDHITRTTYTTQVQTSCTDDDGKEW